MRVVLDGLSARAGGGRNHLKQLLAHDVPVAWMEIYAVVPAGLRIERVGQGIRLLTIDDAFARPLARATWEHSALPRLLRRIDADVLFCPGGTTPRSVDAGRLLVTMSQNMLPFDRSERARYPTGYVKTRLAILERVLLRSMRAADLVIFVSEYARQVLGERLGGAIQRSEVIAHGVAKNFRPSAELPRPGWLPPGDYVHYVSNLEPYKRQLNVVRAFSILKRRRRTGEKLVLVGPASCPSYAREVRREIERLGMTSDIFICGSAPQRDLPAVYGHARVGVFASACENCPSVLLEAMAAGRPLVVSDRPPMPEFAGESVLYANPDDPDQLADRLTTVLDNPALGARLGNRAIAESRRFDWAATAKRTWLAIIAAWRGLPSSDSPASGDS